MAEPLLSLQSSGTMKHVVPWKTRSEFLTVFEDLYSCDVQSQKSAIGRIAAWKSRAGMKLSVAIESSGSLMQVRIQHLEAEKDGSLHNLEQQLRYGYSLALIRFVNHLTEKAQTKAVAQPVHLVAREFGIPEWIVRLRHEATHGALPCLGTLATGARWALDYLRHNFWEQQRVDAGGDAAQAEEGGEPTATATGDKDNAGSTHQARPLKVSAIRKAFHDYREVRNERNELAPGEEAETDHSSALGKLQKYLALDRMKFIKCMLEDGVIIATDEQLQDFGTNSEDVLRTMPPTVPQRMALFWRPLLKRLNNAGALALWLHTTMSSVTSEHGLRNYQLVAWIYLMLAYTSSTASARGKRKKVKREDCYMRVTHPVPTKTLLFLCTQNLNKLTVNLLRFLIDPQNLGSERCALLQQQLQVKSSMPRLKWTGIPSNIADSSTSCDSDTDTDTDCQDLGDNKAEDVGYISTTVDKIEKTLVEGTLPWNVCTDPVDWASVPLGVLPNYAGGGKQVGSHGRRHRLANSSEWDQHDDEDDEDSDESNSGFPAKRTKLIVTGDLLI